MKRILYLVFVTYLVTLLGVASISLAAEPGRRIGILTFGNQVRYMESIGGFMDAFKEAGPGEPQPQFIIEDAGSNKAVAAELVKKLAAAKLDLIFAVGTQATVAACQEITTVPIVFAQVYDPVEAGIAKSWQSSGNNTTGVSTKIPMSLLIDKMKQLRPVNNLSVLYTPGEKNSESQLRDLQEIQKNSGIAVIPVPLAKVEDIQQILPILMARTDAMFITGSNFVNNNLTTVLDMAIKGKIITVSHLEDLVEKGVLLGLGPNPYTMGRLAGQKAMKIFEGVQPSRIPIEMSEQLDVILNMKTVKAGGISDSTGIHGHCKQEN